MKKNTYIVRVARDAAGCLVGQISDPFDGRRRPFATAEELWQLLISDGQDEQKKETKQQDRHSPDPSL